MKKLITGLLLYTMLASTLVGCGSSSTSTTTAAQAPAATQAAPAATQAAETKAANVKDTLIAGVTADPPSFAPDAGGNLVAQLTYTNIYNRLVELNDKGEYVPYLAESYEVSDDGLDYTFHLRKGVTFHNGQPFTSEDVKYSLDRFCKSSVIGVYFTNYESTEIVDDYTCIVHYSAPYSGTKECLFSIRGSNILDKTTCEDMGVDMNTDPIGTGPYKYVSRVSGDKYELERFEDYWGEKPQIRHITFKVISDATSAAIALEAGEIDCIYNTVITEKQNVEGNPDLAWYEIPAAATMFCRFNCSDPVLKDVRVRKAIQLAVDKQSMCDIVSEGQGDLVSVLFNPAGTAYPDNVKDVERDVEKAKQLLAEAGYANGLTLHILASPERPLYYGCAQVMQSQLAEIGIDLQMDVMDAASMFDTAESQHNFQLFITQQALTAKDNNTLVYRSYHSDFLADANFGEYNNPKCDEILDRMIKEFDVDKRRDICAEFSELILEEAPAIPLYVYYYYFAANSKLKGVEMSPTLIIDYSKFYWEE